MPSTAEAEAAAAESPIADEVAAALRQLAADGLVAYPTETVWGLGACGRSEAALAALRRFKGRDAGQPISVLVSGAGELGELGFEIGEAAERLMRAFWPGPLTLVLPCVRATFATGVARSGDDAVGVRCSSHPVALALARAAASAGLGPLTATSLNRSGEAPVESRRQALQLCSAAGESTTVLPDEGGATDSAPSTVVDLCAPRPRILRAGAIGRAAIEKLVGPLAEREVTA